MTVVLAAGMSRVPPLHYECDGVRARWRHGLLTLDEQQSGADFCVRKVLPMPVDMAA